MVNDEEARGEQDGESSGMCLFLLGKGRRFDKAGLISVLGRNSEASFLHLPIQSVDEDPFRHDDGCSLKIHRLPALILQTKDSEHFRICPASWLGEKPFEIGEKGWIIQRPRRRLFVVPFSRGQTGGNGKPVTMYFKIRRFAREYLLICVLNWRYLEGTYYAGKSSTLNAVATTALCAMVG